MASSLSQYLVRIGFPESDAEAGSQINIASRMYPNTAMAPPLDDQAWEAKLCLIYDKSVTCLQQEIPEI